MRWIGSAITIEQCQYERKDRISSRNMTGTVLRDGELTQYVGGGIGSKGIEEASKLGVVRRLAIATFSPEARGSSAGLEI